VTTSVPGKMLSLFNVIHISVSYVRGISFQEKLHR